MGEGVITPQYDFENTSRWRRVLKFTKYAVPIFTMARRPRKISRKVFEPLLAICAQTVITGGEVRLDQDRKGRIIMRMPRMLCKLALSKQLTISSNYTLVSLSFLHCFSVRTIRRFCNMPWINNKTVNDKPSEIEWRQNMNSRTA